MSVDDETIVDRAARLNLTDGERTELWRMADYGRHVRCSQEIAVIRYSLASAGFIEMESGMWRLTNAGKDALREIGLMT